MEMARVDLCEQMRRSLLSFEGRIEEKRVEGGGGITGNRPAG